MNIFESRSNEEHVAEEPKQARVLHFPSERVRSDQAVPDAESSAGPVVEGEVLDVEPVMVDQPGRESSGSTVGSGRRRPILPVWARSVGEFRDAARWALGYVAHASAFHAVRCPVYLGRLLVRLPQGMVRFVAGIVRWVSDAEGQALRDAAARREDGGEYLKLSRQRDGRVRARSILFAAGATAVLVAVGAGRSVLPELVQWAVVAGAAAGLGWLGASADRPIASRAVVATRVQKLTSDIVVKALSALGIAEINKAMGKGGAGISFPKPITRDGPGWRADVDLPHGVTVTDIIERREQLASGLRRPLGCVWPEPDGTEHAGRLMLWVGDQDLAKAPGRAWPLVKRGQADIFEPLPLGTDQRGRPVSVLLMFANVLIGAMPRFGKTFALRVLLLGASLDPRVELRLFELKGTGDLSALEKVAHEYASGITDPAIEAALNSLREMNTELERRSETISKLPKSVCPENKVTPQLAARKDLGLQPVVVAVDECQNLFTHAEFGKEAGELCEKLIKVGPALGIILILATQRPDAKSLPTGVSANAGIRFCLRVMGQTENDMVLGTSAYKNGVRATMFTAKDKGIGYLVGNADDPQIARSDYIDGPAADAITDRARTLRHAAGTLTGHAIGDVKKDGANAVDTLLEDLLTVVAPGETKVWTETAVTRLVERWPEVYGQWEADQLTAVLKTHGIKTNRQVWGTDASGDGRNRRGFHRADIATAVANRSRTRGGD